MISLQNALEPSSSAPAAVGPKQRMAALARASATPATRGASGPTTTRAAPTSRARATTASPSRASTSRTATSRAMPALPGAHTTSGVLGERASACTRACSRAPPPMTRTVSGTSRSDRADEVVDRDRAQRLIAARTTGAELQRDAGDRLRVGSLDDVDEIELAERRPLGLDRGAQLLHLTVDLADPGGVVLDRLHSLRRERGEHDVGGHLLLLVRRLTSLGSLLPDRDRGPQRDPAPPSRGASAW